LVLTIPPACIPSLLFYYTQFLNVVPKDQFVSAVLGFLSYRVPLLYTELKGAFTGGIADQLVEVLPGSVAKTVQVVNQYNKNKPGPSMDASANAAVRAAPDAAAKVLLVAGPPATGKTSLVSKLVASYSSGAGSSRLRRPPIATTRPPRAGEEDEGKFVFVDRLTFAQLQREGQLVAAWSDSARGGGSDGADGGLSSSSSASSASSASSSASSSGLEVLMSGELDLDAETAAGRGMAGAGELYGLRVGDVLAAGRGGGVCVIDAKDTDAADAVAAVLEDRPDVSLTGLWVSLNTLTDFEERLTAVNPAFGGVGDDTGEGPALLRAELKRVINAIEWGVMSGLFEFTVINDDAATALEEMKKSVAFLLGEDLTGEGEDAEGSTAV
jgi:hypothetical protein